jgi:hypothetical protein
MNSQNKSQDHSNLVVCFGALFLLLAPSVVLSGAILLPLGTMLVLTYLAAARDRVYGLMVGLICLMFFMVGYRYSIFSDYPVNEWYDLVIFNLTELLGGQPGATPMSRVPWVVARLSVLLLPFGIGVWGWFFTSRKWHQKGMKFMRQKRINGLNFPRLRRRGKDTFLGVDKKSGVSVILSEDMRVRHTQVLGATGYGKTESVLMTMIRNDIENGRGLLLIDGKGDLNFRDQIMTYARHCGREADLRYLSYSHSDASMRYNPLLNGSSAEVRDRIVDSLEWSEEYYKKCASSALLMALQILEHQNRKPTLELVKDFLMFPEAFGKSVPDTLKPLYRDFCGHHNKRYPEVHGLVTDLCNIILSGSGRKMISTKPDINLVDAVREKQIVIFQVSTLDYGMTARTFGRLAIQDMKAVCGILNRERSTRRGLFSMYIDEFESFAHESFNELLSKARSAGIGITISHQSLGDLEKVGPFFQKQITENTNNKIILRVNDEETVEYFSGMAGTRKAERMTYQIEDGVMARKTGAASLREVEEFIVHPNDFRKLGIGEAVVMTHNNQVSKVVKLDRAPRMPVACDYTSDFTEWNKERSRNEFRESVEKTNAQRLSTEIF